MKILKVYKFATYFLQLFFIVGIVLTIKEIYEGITIFDYRSVLLIILLFLLFLSVSFYNNKSHKFHNDENFRIEDKKEITKIKIVTLINIFIGITISLLFLIVLTVYPIKDLSFNEITRTLLSLILLLYGILKTIHSLKTLKRLKTIN